MLAFEASISSLSPHSLSVSIILMPDSENPFEPLDKTASFEHTNWFTIRQAGVPESPGADAARDHICQAYWYPIYFYVRRLGHSVQRVLHRSALVGGERVDDRLADALARGKGRRARAIGPRRGHRRREDRKSVV